MTLQAISKGFEYYKKFGLNFTIKIRPLIFLFGFLASIGSSSSLSDGISNFDIFWLLINNFLISPLLTIIAIFIANDLIENNNRDFLVYYAISWQFLLKVLILSLISTLCIGNWPTFICCPRNINCWITYLCELFCNLRE